MESVAHTPAEPYLALIEVSRIIASWRTLSDLFHDLSEHLHRLLNFHYLSVVLCDTAHDVMRTHILEMAGRGGRAVGAGCLPGSHTAARSCERRNGGDDAINHGG
jgi:hypothetical protein